MISFISVCLNVYFMQFLCDTIIFELTLHTAVVVTNPEYDTAPLLLLNGFIKVSYCINRKISVKK